MGLTMIPTPGNIQKINKLTMMCPSCFAKKETEFYADITKSDPDLAIVISPYYTCKCGDRMDYIDEDIIDDIILLNKYGFKTVFCCSGHGSNRAYISFKTSRLYKFCIHHKIIPDGWEWDESDNHVLRPCQNTTIPAEYILPSLHRFVCKIISCEE